MPSHPRRSFRPGALTAYRSLARNLEDVLSYIIWGLHRIWVDPRAHLSHRKSVLKTTRYTRNSAFRQWTLCKTELHPPQARQSEVIPACSGTSLSRMDYAVQDDDGMHLQNGSKHAPPQVEGLEYAPGVSKTDLAGRVSGVLQWKWEQPHSLNNKGIDWQELMCMPSLTGLNNKECLMAFVVCDQSLCDGADLLKRPPLPQIRVHT